jgi:hypothetical protein
VNPTISSTQMNVQTTTSNNINKMNNSSVNDVVEADSFYMVIIIFTCILACLLLVIINIKYDIIRIFTCKKKGSEGDYGICETTFVTQLHEPPQPQPRRVFKMDSVRQGLEPCVFTNKYVSLVHLAEQNKRNARRNGRRRNRGIV